MWLPFLEFDAKTHHRFAAVTLRLAGTAV